MSVLRWFGLVLVIIFLGVRVINTEAATPVAPDIRLILQTQAGLSAYAVITDTITLSQVRPIFSNIERENSEYLQGEYTLSGRTDKVKLAVGHAGWAIAWHTR
jgi:hypothetical protein